MRDKEHSAEPMTVDQALYQIELVGHDFYLFLDADAGGPAWSTAARASTTAPSTSSDPSEERGTPWPVRDAASAIATFPPTGWLAAAAPAVLSGGPGASRRPVTGQWRC